MSEPAPTRRPAPVERAPGPSVRLKLTLSYAGFLMIAGVGLIAVVWLFLLRYVPEQAITLPTGGSGQDTSPWPPSRFIPGRGDLWAAFAPKVAIMLALLLVFGLLGGWLLAGRMLAPLTRITDATRRAGDGQLSHRIQIGGRQDEFRELADAFDTMLDQLEAHVAEHQRFAANASHELRTPLAITQTMLDVAREDPGRDTAALVENLHQMNTRAIALTEALLLLSRADQQSFTAEPVDLSLAVDEAVETLLPLAERNGVRIETDTDLAFTAGSPALLLQLVTGLLHNAIVHNLAETGFVRLATALGPTTVRLTMENSGDHLDPELVATLAEPFRRGTDRIRTGQAGVGLGLAIAQSIVRAHRGNLTLAARPAGGLEVIVEMPRAPKVP